MRSAPPTVGPSPFAGWLTTSPYARARARLANARHEEQRFLRSLAPLTSLLGHLEQCPTGTTADPSALDDLLRALDEHLTFYDRVFDGVDLHEPTRSAIEITSDLRLATRRYERSIVGPADHAAPPLRRALDTLEHAWATTEHLMDGLATLPLLARWAHQHVEALDRAALTTAAGALPLREHLATTRDAISARGAVLHERVRATFRGEMALLASYQSSHYLRVAHEFAASELHPALDVVLDALGDDGTLASTNPPAVDRPQLDGVADHARRLRGVLTDRAGALGTPQPSPSATEHSGRRRRAARPTEPHGTDPLTTAARARRWRAQLTSALASTRPSAGLDQPLALVEAFSLAPAVRPGPPDEDDRAPHADHPSSTSRPATRAPSVLLVAPHADDEWSKLGALAAELRSRYAARITLVAATDNSAGAPQEPRADTPFNRRNFPDVRTEELVDASIIGGFETVILLNHGDSGMEDDPSMHHGRYAARNLDEVAEEFHLVLEAVQPDLVLTVQVHEEQQPYHHPDHERTFDMVVEGVRRARHAGSASPALLAASLPSEAVAPTVERLLGDTHDGSPLAWALAPTAAPTHHVTLSDASLALQRRGLAAYRTQVAEGTWKDVAHERVAHLRQVLPEGPPIDLEALLHGGREASPTHVPGPQAQAPRSVRASHLLPASLG